MEGASAHHGRPFKLGSIDQTAKTVTLVRNEKWWGEAGKAGHDRVSRD